MVTGSELNGSSQVLGGSEPTLIKSRSLSPFLPTLPSLWHSPEDRPYLPAWPGSSSLACCSRHRPSAARSVYALLPALVQPQRRVSEPFISSASLHVQLTLSLARNCSYCCHRPVPSEREYELVRLLNIKPQKSMCNLLARVHRSCLVDGGIGYLRRIHLDVLAKPRGIAPQSRMLRLKNFSTGKLKFETY